MKNKLTILTLILGLGSSFMLSSCSKDDDNGTKTETRTDFVKAKINGAQMNIDPASTVAEYEPTQDVVNITAYSKDQTVVLAIYFNLKEGSQAIPADGATGTLQYTTDPDNGIYDATTGVVNITKVDKTKKIVEGNFQFTATNTPGDIKNVSEASFSYVYK